MVKKIITNLNSSKVPGPDCIPVALPKNCEPELFSIVPEFCNEGLKKSCFPDCLYHPFSLLSVASKVFEKLVIGLLITYRDVAFFLISSMVLGLSDQLQIF